jgi:S-DNA-T family DNA segregation ATPase FtsK/SpoIIIE
VACKGFYVDNPKAVLVAARAMELRRKAGTLPTGSEDRDTAPTFDVLADLVAVWPDGEDKAWNETLVERLAGLRDGGR